MAMLAQWCCSPSIPTGWSRPAVPIRTEQAAASHQTNQPARQKASAEGPGELFPHLYGPLPLEAVLEAEP
jgi:hypothetical protein